MPFQKPQLFTQAVRIGSITAVASGLAVAKDTYFQGAGTKPFLFVVLVVAVIVSKVVELFLEYLFETSRWWRSFLLGRNNIEGLWAQKLKVDGIRCLGILSVEYSAAAFEVHGWRYDLEGRQIASWRSLLLEFDGTELRYLYETRYQELSLTQHGYSTVTFIRSLPTKRPESCNGHFLDLAAGGITHTYQAARLDRETTLAFARDASRTAREILIRHEEETPTPSAAVH